VTEKDYRLQRHGMVETQLARRGIEDTRVLDAMRRVPREAFVPERLRCRAYDDSPLSIGEGQTISQPYMVAVMTEALALGGTEKVLEIGTGSGYQTAVLAECAREIATVERIGPLLERAKAVLGGLGYSNISFIRGDGTKGRAEAAPYDAIIVTAGAPKVPDPLKEQLAAGGRLVIPVGDRHFQQCLKITRQAGRYIEETLTGCTFVPLLGEEGW
jgi:protein-L-isoaspartate(D-aspartate) O-methyltransferase